jgi:hypothetical protein
MDINVAVETIEAFVERYRREHPTFAPVETQVRPSGDDQGAVKLWFNHGPEVAAERLAVLEAELVAALKAAHPELAAVRLEVRSEAF